MVVACVVDDGACGVAQCHYVAVGIVHAVIPEHRPFFSRCVIAAADCRYRVLPLHSQVSPQDQRQVFRSVPAGCRKVILATNIAETAITIDDVVCVINSGRMKERSYDPFTGVSTLQVGGL